MCQNSLPSGVGRSLGAKISGGRGCPWGIFFVFLQNQTHYAIQQCKLHRATCRRFDTIPACDGQTDGIAVASTALAMRALWRAVNKTFVCDILDKWNSNDTLCISSNSHVTSSSTWQTLLMTKVKGHLDWLLTNGKQPPRVSSPPPQTTYLQQCTANVSSHEY